jgi:hypothetical protein
LVASPGEWTISRCDKQFGHTAGAPPQQSSPWHCRCSIRGQQAKTQARRSKAKRARRSKEKSDARQNATRREHRLSQGAASGGVPPPQLLNPPPLPVQSSTGSGLPPRTFPSSSSPDQPERWLEAKKERPPLLRATGVSNSFVMLGFGCRPGRLKSDRTKKKPACSAGLFRILPAVTYSPTQLARAVPSAVEGLTSVFGMGTGVTPLL